MSLNPLRQGLPVKPFLAPQAMSRLTHGEAPVAEPQPNDVKSPAEQVAGPNLDKRREHVQEHLHAAEVATRLNVLSKMYKQLLRCQVGTGAIESEAMLIVWERSPGPMGHASLLSQCTVSGMNLSEMYWEEEELVEEVRSGKIRKEKESEEEKVCEPVTSPGTMFWQDKSLIRKLVQLRLDSVNKKWRQSKASLSETMRKLAIGSTREEMRDRWQEVQNMTREVWNEEHPQHQRKVQHLAAKSRTAPNTPGAETWTRWSRTGSRLGQWSHPWANHLGVPKAHPVWEHIDKPQAGHHLAVPTTGPVTTQNRRARIEPTNQRVCP